MQAEERRRPACIVIRHFHTPPPALSLTGRNPLRAPAHLAAFSLFPHHFARYSHVSMRPAATSAMSCFFSIVVTCANERVEGEVHTLYRVHRLGEHALAISDRPHYFRFIRKK